MSTTVPQNIKGCNISGSHLPTRSSLRHSRMLVGGKKSYQGKCAVYTQISDTHTQTQSKRWVCARVRVSVHTHFLLD